MGTVGGAISPPSWVPIGSRNHAWGRSRIGKAAASKNDRMMPPCCLSTVIFCIGGDLQACEGMLFCQFVKGGAGTRHPLERFDER
jgi:hypothetical protein